MYLRLRSKIRSEAADDSTIGILCFSVAAVDLVAGDQPLVVADRAVSVAGVVVVDQLDGNLAALDGDAAGLVGLLGPKLIAAVRFGRVRAELAGQRNAVAQRDLLLVLCLSGTSQDGLAEQDRKASQQQSPCRHRHDFLPVRIPAVLSLPANFIR